MKKSALVLVLVLCLCMLFSACGEGEKKIQNDITTPVGDDVNDPTADDVTPDEPTEPSEPTEPETPDEPSEPSKPTEPETPDEPSEPSQPETPTQPETPVQPDEPTTPSDPEQPEEEPENYDGLEPWQIAYLEYLKEDLEYYGSTHWISYSLVFVDSDNVPELFTSGPDSASGEHLCSYKNGQLVCQQLRRTGGSRYIPTIGLVYNHQGNTDHYFTSVYQLTDSGFVELFYGTNENRRYQTLDTNGEVTTKAVMLYYIDGKEVTEEEHDAEVAKHFDYSKSKSFFKDGPVVNADYDTVYKQIKDWDYSILPPAPPAEPEKPTEPENPTEPDVPTTPSDIVTPPAKPETPSTPTSPSDIVTPPSKPTQPEAPAEPKYPDISNDPVALAGGIPQIVYDAIDEGDWEKAYAMLYNIENKSSVQKKFLSHFVFLPKEVFGRYSRQKLHIYKFDEQGNIYSDKYYTLDGEVEEYYYNKDGTLQTVTYYTSWGSFDDFTYIYNKKGQAVQCIFETDYGSKTILNYTYDDAGNLISQETSYEKRTYTYDKMGNLLSETRQNVKTGEVTLFQTYTYAYDQNGNLLTRTCYDSSGKIDFQTTLLYDEKGHRIETKTIYSNGSITSVAYERDEKGNILLETTQQSGKTTKIEYTYDEYGNVLTSKKSSENIVYSYTYELHYFPNNTPHIPDLPAINR